MFGGGGGDVFTICNLLYVHVVTRFNVNIKKNMDEFSFNHLVSFGLHNLFIFWRTQKSVDFQLKT